MRSYRHKKAAGLAPCGLSGLPQMTLVIIFEEFWWAGESELFIYLVNFIFYLIQILLVYQ